MFGHNTIGCRIILWVRTESHLLDRPVGRRWVLGQSLHWLSELTTNTHQSWRPG